MAHGIVGDMQDLVYSVEVIHRSWDGFVAIGVNNLMTLLFVFNIVLCATSSIDSLMDICGLAAQKALLLTNSYRSISGCNCWNSVSLYHL